MLSRADYQRVFEQGEKQVGRHFVCYLVRREEPGSKLGLVVSRKVGNAVARNRVKRRIREYFRLHQHEFTGAAEVVVVARLGAAALDGAATAESLHRLFKRGGLQDG